MKYVGSKRLFAKYIIPTILGYIGDNVDTIENWYEPFVGGANNIERVPKYIGGLNMYGSDYNSHTIQALKLIRDKPLLLPRSNKYFTKEDYYRIKKLPEHHLHGFVGITLSFGGKWWGGWARDNTGRDYVKQTWNSAIKESQKLQNTNLYVSDYKQDFKSNSVIYCDPPYKASIKTTKGYKEKSFDHDTFWEYIRTISKSNYVFVSEYEAPEDFTCLWEKEVKTTLNNAYGDTSKTNVEKLFVYEDGK